MRVAYLNAGRLPQPPLTLLVARDQRVGDDKARTRRKRHRHGAQRRKVDALGLAQLAHERDGLIHAGGGLELIVLGVIIVNLTQDFKPTTHRAAVPAALHTDKALAPNSEVR